MRWPLKSQILLRMLLLVLLSIFAVTFANIRSTIAVNQAAEQIRLERIVKLVKSTRFPLTTTVLENMNSLSGAEFILQDSEGTEISSTQSAPPLDQVMKLADRPDPSTYEQLGKTYHHRVVKTSPHRSRELSKDRLHIFVPRQSDREIWWQSSKTPIGIALLALPIAILISWAMANQVTKPLARLENQVQKIAAGDAQQIQQIRRNDEIRDLGNSINDLANQLKDHDEQLRRNERLKNMVQIGSSIAHHLRNSSTGCKLAIELMADRHPDIAISENYQVACRQLELMDTYIKRFLLLSKSPDRVHAPTAQPLQLEDVLESTLFLLRPNAEHLGVSLNIDSDVDGSLVCIGREDAQQMMINLIANAISAACESGSLAETEESPQVNVTLKVRNGRFSFSVIDNGNGPPKEIAGSLFEPFVTGKSEGTGLGLAVVQDIAERTGGTVNWERCDGATEFIFQSNHGSN